MNVPLMLYIYLVSCLAMILFNLAYLITARSGGILRWNMRAFRNRIEECWEHKITVPDRGLFQLKLHFPLYIILFDQIMTELQEKDSRKTADFLESFGETLAELLCHCGKRSVLRASSYAYCIRNYPQMKMERFPEASEKLIQMLGSSDIYCRENALQALYALGNAQYVVRALLVLNRNPEQHNSMVLSTGLQNFSGSHEQLASELWNVLGEFNPNLQISIIKYIYACSGSFCPQMLELITKGQVHGDVSICAIRYLGKYPYQPAYSILLEMAADAGETSWEQSAEACTALKAYPGNATIKALKKALGSWKWEVKVSAAESLSLLGLHYLDALDILEGPNRPAAEILRYELEHASLAKEAIHI